MNHHELVTYSCMNAWQVCGSAVRACHWYSYLLCDNSTDDLLRKAFRPDLISYYGRVIEQLWISRHPVWICSQPHADKCHFRFRRFEDFLTSGYLSVPEWNIGELNSRVSLNILIEYKQITTFSWNLSWNSRFRRRFYL